MTIHSQPSRGPVAAAVVAVGAVLLLALGDLAGANMKVLAPVLGIALVASVAYKILLPWRSQLALIIFVIFFVPIKRYILPASLPFQLEPYRLVVGLVFVAWLTSLLIDRRVRLRSTAFDAPILAYLLCVVLSLLANPHRVAQLSTDVVKGLLFLATFFIVYYLVASIVTNRHDLDFVVRWLAGGGTVVAVSAIVESRTNFNVFNHLGSIMPFLHFTGSTDLSRSGRLRVVASAQHPIALGAALMMLIPLSVYLARLTRHKRWWISAFLLLLGSLATSSRTSITMLGAMLLVYIASRARDLKRLWPAIIPLIAVVHFAIPGELGATFKAFFPQGGLIEEQKAAGNGHGRIASFWPAMHNEVSKDPLFGEGFSTRIVTPTPSTPVPNAKILDDQWLGSLCETGLAGIVTLAWLYATFIRRMRRASRGDDSPRAWLLVGAAAAVAAFAVGMFTYDAFAFIQVTFLLFITLGVGAVALRLPATEWETETAAATVRKPRHGSPIGLRPLPGGHALAPDA